MVTFSIAPPICVRSRLFPEIKDMWWKWLLTRRLRNRLYLYKPPFFTVRVMVFAAVEGSNVRRTTYQSYYDGDADYNECRRCFCICGPNCHRNIFVFPSS